MADQQPAREDLCTRFLREIADVPTTSFFEHRVNNRIRRILTEQFGQNEVVETSADGFGNVIVHYKGSKNVDHPLNIAYVVHTDHPGFHATPLASKQLMLKLMGGLNKGLVVGSLVDLYDCYDHELPCITRGIISEEFDAESANPSGRYRMATDDHVDQRAFAVLHLPELEISDSIIRAPVLDDYASIAMSLAALKDVVDKKLSVDVYVVFHRGEEIGFVGAYGVASSELFGGNKFV
jgi:putative aminopeptidase FrvX